MVLLFSRCVSCEGSRLLISHNFAVSGFQSYLCLNTVWTNLWIWIFNPLCHLPEFIILEYINNSKPLACVSDWFLLLQGCMLHSMTVLLLSFQRAVAKTSLFMMMKNILKQNRKRQKEQNEKRWIYFKKQRQWVLLIVNNELIRFRKTKKSSSLISIQR